MRVGIDYRPALVNREGIGRYVRELVRAMLELEFGGNLGLFGYTLAGAKFSRAELGLVSARAELLRLRFPSKALPWLLSKLDKGVDDLVGGCQVYHHTHYSRLAVRAALEVATIHDCLYLKDADYVDAHSAARMGATARALAGRARRILVPSEFVGAEVVLHFGAWPSQITVTPLGCDHLARALPPGGYPRAKEPYVLTVSRVDNRKNHVRMLAAFERLVADGLPQRWVVAGPPGHGVEHFERALARSPAAKRVEWRRNVSEAELPKLYAQADLFLFASLGEGFGLPPLEAMVAGTPVVTSSITSLPEVCGDAAWYVDPSDPERIFEAARRLLREPELAAELVQKGHAQARKFTWRETARQTLIAYQKATEPPEADDHHKLRRSL
ncbi:MAG: glycosyltransferase family 1 protein [Planctomycetes bacterium]|nr:glycosyltransferase family 1 protein [Planctomycetota bacterium]